MNHCAVTLGIVWLMVLGATAAPIAPPQAVAAANAFIGIHMPATNGLPVRSTAHTGPSHRRVVAITPVATTGMVIGFVVVLEPDGYLLMRTDDRLRPVKLYADTGSYSNLPPAFLTVMQKELLGELAALARRRAWAAAPQRHPEWQTLLEPQTAPVARAKIAIGPLLTTRWDQDWPYNYCAPPASGGPNGLAYAGCVACAMAQILRYWEEPFAILKNTGYVDRWGWCRYVNYASDFGLEPYDWTAMPDEANWSVSPYQCYAIARLMYHCGVTVRMNYEAHASSAYSSSVPRALRRYFGYACTRLYARRYSSFGVWFDFIMNNMRWCSPMYYAFNDRHGGHAVVCDGASENYYIHINMGWGGAWNAWYDIDDVAGFRYNHRAIGYIRPVGVY